MPFCFEILLKSDYESLHLLNNVNCALTKHSKEKKKKKSKKNKKNESD